jgi:hypothetical protein
MSELKIKIPEEIGFFKQVSDIDWSIVVSKLIKSKLGEISRLKKALSKSKFSESDVKEFSDKINSSLSQRYLE